MLFNIIIIVSIIMLIGIVIYIIYDNPEKKEIAKSLYVSEGTWKSTVEFIKKKEKYAILTYKTFESLYKVFPDEFCIESNFIKRNNTYIISQKYREYIKMMRLIHSKVNSKVPENDETFILLKEMRSKLSKEIKKANKTVVESCENIKEITERIAR